MTDCLTVTLVVVVAFGVGVGVGWALAFQTATRALADTLKRKGWL